MERGKLIVFESGEGGGKSTHIEWTRKYLVGKDIPFEIVREPGGTEISEEIRGLLLNKKLNKMNPLTELYLFQASRSQLFSEKLISKLEGGISLGQDRSGDSSVAYQGYGRGMDINFIKYLNINSTFGYKPDLEFIIDIDPEKGLEKELNENRMSIAGLEFHKRVRQGYLELAKENPKNYVLIPYIENGIKEMQEMMKVHIDKLFGF